MRSVIAALCILTSLAAQAGDTGLDDAAIGNARPVIDVGSGSQSERICPNPKKLRGMCMLLSSQEKDPSLPGRFVYLYQRKFLEAACVDVGKDSDEVIARKISKVWSDNESTLICNNTKFDVSNGSMIKFAVNLKFDPFITDMTFWKVNLNKVDQTDGRTLLDYVKDHIDRNAGLATEPILRGYYAQLKKAGAKHKSEL